jgi:hypothetical protein
MPTENGGGMNKGGELHQAESGCLAMPGHLLAPIVFRAGRRFLEFFTAQIRNPNTRKAYARAAGGFFAWCNARGLGLEQIEPMIVAAFIEQHPASTPTVKQHLAALRHLFDWLVIGQILAGNPARSVKGPEARHATGKTPVRRANRRGRCSTPSKPIPSKAGAIAHSSRSWFTPSGGWARS